MSINDRHQSKDLAVTPPNSFVATPLTPPPTDEKPNLTVSKVIQLFRNHKAGKRSDPWTVIQLEEGNYQGIESQLRADESLWGYVNDKIRSVSHPQLIINWTDCYRYDYDPVTRRLVVRMPTAVHEEFLAEVVRDIQGQLGKIRDTSSGA